MKGIRIFGFILSFGVYTQCLAHDNQLQINHIQVLGSHNSYKQLIQPELYKEMKIRLEQSFEDIEYRHPSLEIQLNKFKLRNLELDVLYDPDGGLYSSPTGNQWLLEQGIQPDSFDPKKELKKPGFKVLHLPDIDFRSQCLTLKSCLAKLKNWSDSNPNHLPIAITFNAKSDHINFPKFAKPQSFSELAFKALDAEFIKYLGKDNIIKPDDVRGNHKTLKQAVLNEGWPTLEKSRGKFILVLDETGEKRQTYQDKHPSLKNRVMFTNAPESEDEAAFMIINEPRANKAKIQNLVKKGFLIRTRADAGTIEARNNDYSRFEAAKESGAQFITTDYYQVEPLMNTDFKVIFENETSIRCNTQLVKQNCRFNNN
ncbi:hypothetical protein D5R81_17540 [Parashewanella spongiae]|uniref:Calcium-dependent phosphoinositide phospholipase C n=1 Tax=Parashewanella spongiae TaxID=342950 RepID=A0A3A6TP00_9GAMM|nr:phosphatidylinositol-specific phospholipase C1-like protein [Parashewanella spongiae]MCL1079864.1 phosphatidylinositol-specific phospholipase C1-like protein [Parashewanella spongiae]RJY06667.1 hypothetical protein D5R81_17540 [Parashewanella spongiae]